MTAQGEARGQGQQLSDSIAHDVRELLSNILVLSDWIEHDVGDPVRVRMHVNQMRAAAQRANELMERLSPAGRSALERAGWATPAPAPITEPRAGWPVPVTERVGAGATSTSAAPARANSAANAAERTGFAANALERAGLTAPAERGGLGAGAAERVNLSANAAANSGARGSFVRTVSDELPCGYGESVLLVDDEPRVCDSLRRLLEQLGYNPTAETDPARALEYVQRQPDRFELVLADLTMPSMSGIDLARSIRRYAKLPFLLMSGFANPGNQSVLAAVGIETVLSKPISVVVLAHAMRIPLDLRRASANQEFCSAWARAR
jgi:CheY-like chemotaxis protein